SDLNNNNAPVAAFVTLLLFGVMAYVLLKGYSDTKLPVDGTPTNTKTVSDLIFKPYLLPFWALSFVLLAAVIGAIVLARKD
ncbi:MAG: NADH-quinone oxidoreductase subunit, partial [Actinomycetota bacterium]